jgi:DICT domain-containing protein
VKGLAIKDVAEQTGLAAGTIRMWEQRYGFPEPERTPSGYRVYTPDDVELLRRVISYREGGLSVPAALDRARAAGGPTDRPSIYGAIMGGLSDGRPLRLTKRTLLAISRGIEDETLARAARPVVVGSFQEQRHFRAVEHRYKRLARAADLCVAFADFDRVEGGDRTTWELPISSEDALGNEWAVIVDAPGYAACLLAWEQPGLAEAGGPDDGERRFEAIWTIDAEATRRAAQVAARLAGRADPAFGARLEELLSDRPLALEEPAPALTALTNRMVAYLEGAR